MAWICIIAARLARDSNFYAMKTCISAFFLFTSWSQAATLISGSPYNIDLGTNDGNFSIMWEGNTLLGAGDVTSYSFFARGTNPVRPLLVQQSGATYSIVGVGNPYTPSTTGMQNNIPFSLASGTTSFNTAGGSRYFFAFSRGSGPSSSWIQCESRDRQPGARPELHRG